jgi:predicted nucleic acid-binding protein
MIHYLLDSDVLLDVYLQREPFYLDSAKVLSLTKRKLITGYITPLALSNVSYLLQKEHSKSIVIDELKRLCTFVEIATMNKKTVLDALESNFTDFEDALQNYSAENITTISHLITRNTKDYSKSRLIVLNPTEFLTIV